MVHASPGGSGPNRTVQPTTIPKLLRNGKREVTELKATAVWEPDCHEEMYFVCLSVWERGIYTNDRTQGLLPSREHRDQLPLLSPINLFLYRELK